MLAWGKEGEASGPLFAQVMLDDALVRDVGANAFEMQTVTL